MSVYFQDDTVMLLLGDAAEQAATLPPSSVQTVVTSPPYFGLRDYGVEGQLGAESSPAEYVTNLVAVFDAIRPALADDGTLWVNLGDSYQSKDLLGIPWRVAFAMQDAGWILRNSIIWVKANAMPESVTDRLSSRHENVFMFSKSRRYWFDLDPIREPHVSDPSREGANALRGQKALRAVGPNSGAYSEGGRNPGDVWTIATRPFSGAHFATFPPELPERCILAGSRAGDTVLDPFSGSGTTGMVANKHGRRYIGIDLNPEYHGLALKTRLAQGALIGDAA